MKMTRMMAFVLVLALSVGMTPAAALAQPTVERASADNGLVLLLSEDHSLPFVTIQLLVDAGSRRDPAGQEGLANLTARGLLLGTASMKSGEINEQLDFIGASLDAAANRDYSSLTMRVLKKDLEKGFGLFADVLLRPAFPVDEIRREREKTIASIQAEEDEPEAVAEKAFMKSLFPKNPYGHPVEGTRESLAGLGRDEAEKFYRAFYHPGNAVLSITGDITMAEVKSLLLPLLSGWGGAVIPEESFDRSFTNKNKTVKIDREITQANIVIGQEGVSRENPDYYALSVMNYILGGGGFASRLTQEIRNRRGLAYSVESFFDPGKYPGSFQIVLQTKNATAREAIAIALEQMKLIREKPVSDAELEGAKKYLIGSFPMRYDTQAKLVNFLTQVEYYGLGVDYAARYPSLIVTVTKEDILRVAKKYLHPAEAILVIVGNLKEAAID